MTLSSVTLTAEDNNPVSARCYTFPRRFLYPEVVTFSSIAALAAGAWIPSVFSWFKIDVVLPTALRAALFPSITATLLLVLVLYVKYELRKVHYLLTDEFLVRASSLKVQKMRLIGVESIALIRLPFYGGLLTVKSGRQKIYIPLFLRHIRDLLTHLESACIDTAIAARVDDGVWREAHRRSMLTGAVIKRAARVYKPLLSISIIMIPAAVVTGMFFWNLDLIPLMAWSTFAPAVPITAFATADAILRFRVQRRYTENKEGTAISDPDGETTTILRAGVAYLLLYLLCGIAFRTFVQ